MAGKDNTTESLRMLINVVVSAVTASPSLTFKPSHDLVSVGFERGHKAFIDRQT
jgi:hypothetical protein